MPVVNLVFQSAHAKPLFGRDAAYLINLGNWFGKRIGEICVSKNN